MIRMIKIAWRNNNGFKELANICILVRKFKQNKQYKANFRNFLSQIFSLSIFVQIQYY